MKILKKIVIPFLFFLSNSQVFAYQETILSCKISEGKYKDEFSKKANLLSVKITEDKNIIVMNYKTPDKIETNCKLSVSKNDRMSFNCDDFTNIISFATPGDDTSSYISIDKQLYFGRAGHFTIGIFQKSNPDITPVMFSSYNCELVSFTVGNSKPVNTN